MQKKIFSGIKGGLSVLSVLLFALCLVSTAVAKKPVPPIPTPSNDQTLLNELPNGRPFLLLKTVIEDLITEITTLTTEVATLTTDIGTLQTEITALQKQAANVGDLQYLSFSFAASGGVENIPIVDKSGTAPTFAAGGKNARFEVSFVPTVSAPPTNSFIMAALVSPGTGSTNFIGTNSDGTQTAGNLTSFGPTAVIATITNEASLVAETETTFAISTLSTAPAGTYFVKIFY